MPKGRVKPDPKNGSIKPLATHAAQASANNLSTESVQPTRDDIAALAYALWRDRGCPDGSAETDWLTAERKLHGATGDPSN
jgi:hypothetical protein